MRKWHSTTHTTYCFPDGRRVFRKENGANLEAMFSSEALGLQHLAESARKTSSPPVPEVLAYGREGKKAFILMEEIPTGHLKDVSEFAQALVVLHRDSRADECGFESDNWIGTTLQKNTLHSSWFDFFRDMRLGYQWNLMRNNGFGDAESEKKMQSLMKRLPNLLPNLDDDRPSLLHGDLWGGNWLADNKGKAWLIDPAVYYGHREADIAMTQLFGGFPSGFFEAYNECWPLEPGFSKRQDIYNLYHLCNHVNIFGEGYWGGVLSILQSFS